MNKKEFHILLTNYTALTREEGQSLIALEKEFPYSQVIHGLAARATQDNLLPEKEEQLHLAAIYTTDRAVFKSIMTRPKQDRKIEEDFNYSLERETVSTSSNEQVVIEKLIDKTEAHSEPTHSLTNIQITSKPSSQDILVNDAFYEEIQHDLERLKELKHEFEETVKQYENGTLSVKIERDSIPKINKSADANDELLTGIKSSKKKIKPVGPKQKEQNEIIDQFIKKQPSIKGKVADREKAEPNDDLSQNSLLYNENIISETLVEILIKQGKKEKAIDVLKKLIWKFPQKKAYFAAQIEDLKK